MLCIWDSLWFVYGVETGSDRCLSAGVFTSEYTKHQTFLFFLGWLWMIVLSCSWIILALWGYLCKETIALEVPGTGPGSIGLCQPWWGTSCIPWRPSDHGLSTPDFCGTDESKQYCGKLIYWALACTDHGFPACVPKLAMWPCPVFHSNTLCSFWKAQVRNLLC